MNTPVISIIIPVYKVEKYICRCVDSLLVQTFEDFEIILIDDGSPDGSARICDEYASKDLRVKVIHQPNGGVSSARNAGLDLAKGKWVCFVDPDDSVEKDYLASFFSLGNPDSSCLVMQGLNYVNSTGEKLIRRVEFPLIKMDMISLSQYDNFHNFAFLHEGGPYNKLYCKEIIQNEGIRFDTGMSYHEDHIFYFTYLLQINNIWSISGARYNYYSNPGSLVHRIHPYDKLQNAYFQLRSLLEKVLLHFSIHDNSYLASIRTFICYIHFKAVCTTYLMHISKNDRISVLKGSNLDEYFKRNFQPKSLKDKLIKCIFCLPLSLQDTLLYLLSSNKRK